MSLESVARTAVGRTRDHNEDSVCTESLDRGTLLAVADGMGGHAAGDVASETALEALENAVQNASGTQPKETLGVGIERANEAVRNAAAEDAGREGMGTTLVCALVVDGTAVIANVGDSRAYEITDESIEQITVDQSLVRELVEQGTIDEDEMDDHPQRHVLSQSLGTDEEVNPDFYERDIDGTLLLCSDGLTEEVQSETIHEIVTDAPSLSTAATKLIDKANENGGSDNVSVVLGRSTPDSHHE